MMVYISKFALEDLNEIYEYISANSIFYARKTIGELYDIFELISEFPYLGKKTKYMKNENVRKVIHKNYKIIYHIKSKEIIIESILHKSKNEIHR